MNIEYYLLILARYKWLHIHTGDGLRRLITARGDEEYDACDAYLDPHALTYKNQLKDFCETYMPEIDSKARFLDWCGREPNETERIQYFKYEAELLAPKGWAVIEV